MHLTNTSFINKFTFLPKYSNPLFVGGKGKETV